MTRETLELLVAEGVRQGQEQNAIRRFIKAHERMHKCYRLLYIIEEEKKRRAWNKVHDMLINGMLNPRR